MIYFMASPMHPFFLVCAKQIYILAIPLQQRNIMVYT